MRVLTKQGAVLHIFPQLMRRSVQVGFAAVVLLSLVSCWSGASRELLDSHSIRKEVAQLRAELAALTGNDPISSTGRFTLQLLHSSDMDGSTGALLNVENFSAILSAFRDRFPDNTLVLSSGDNFIPGPRYFAAGEAAAREVLGVPGNGRGDIALLNAMGFQASALGNHELDRGTGEFASIIRAEVGEDGAYPGPAFPYLSSNLVFESDENLAGLVVPDGQDASLVGGGLAGSVVVSVGGQRVGVVGATTPFLESITGSGGITVEPSDYSMDGLAAVIQASVDGLTAQGINKVILLAHMQAIGVEQELAEKLHDVDIIVAGGSNTLLADATDRLRPADVAAGTYPLPYQSSVDEPVLLVNTEADYRYLGRLVVDFDATGKIISESVDPFVSGAYATDRQGGHLFAGQPIPEVSHIVESLRSVLQEKDGNILGRTNVYLAGRREDVRTQETNLGNLTADANLWLARQFDPEAAVSIKNGGGIRDHIGRVLQPPGTTSPDDVQYLSTVANPLTGKEDGDISQLDVEGALRFNNGLVIVPLTAQELRDVLEHSIGFDGAGELPVGSFPQVAGMRFSFKPAATPGQRIRSLAIVDDIGRVVDRLVENGQISGDAQRTIKVVTLDYLANQGDGYPFPWPHPGRADLAGEAQQPEIPGRKSPDYNGNRVIDGPRAVDPGLSSFAAPGTEQEALAEYLAHFFGDKPFDERETVAQADQRIQNLGIPGKEDTVFTLAGGN